MHLVATLLTILLVPVFLPAQVVVTSAQKKDLLELKARVISIAQQYGTQVHYDSERMGISVDSRVLMLRDFSHYVVSTIGKKVYVVFQYFYKSEYPFNALQATETEQNYYVRISVGDSNKNIRMREGTYIDVKLALQHFVDGTPIKDIDKAHTLVANLVENGWFK